MGEQDVAKQLPRISQIEPWVKPFRDQIKVSCGPGWKVLNSRGTMRLQVVDVGSVMLPYEWTLKGSTQALPRIQQIFKRWDGGRVTLTAASQVANTSSSHQKLDFTQ